MPGQDHGAKFYSYSADKSKAALEEKVIFGDRFYMHKEGDRLISYDVHNTVPIFPLKSEEFTKLRADSGRYVYGPEKSADGTMFTEKVVDTHISDWCDDQVRDKMKVPKEVDLKHQEASKKLEIEGELEAKVLLPMLPSALV